MRTIDLITTFFHWGGLRVLTLIAEFNDWEINVQHRMVLLEEVKCMAVACWWECVTGVRERSLKGFQKFRLRNNNNLIVWVCWVLQSSVDKGISFWETKLITTVFPRNENASCWWLFWSKIALKAWNEFWNSLDRLN